MKNKIITVLTIAFAVFFLGFVVQTTDDLSKVNDRILNSKNVIDAGDLISTHLKVTNENLPIEGSWVNSDFDDDEWKKIKIPSYQIVQIPEFKEGNFAYYRIKIPKIAFKGITHLEKESFFVLQSVYFHRFDILINGKFYKTFKPVNAGENRIVVPVEDNEDNLIAIKGYIKPGDTGIDSRNKIMLGKGVEFNAVHSASYKAQTVYQLVFILCKGSILFIFALIYLLLRVDRSFDKFFIFGVCAVVEELIAGDYLYGPLNFNQMVYLYDLVNVGGAISVFLFFGQLTNTTYRKNQISVLGIILAFLSMALAVDSLYWNAIVDLSKFMKFWNIFTVSILIFYVPKVFKIDKILSFGLIVSICLYLWGALASSNIGLNFKAYGNLLLFFMVAYQTFALFKREQNQLQSKELQLLEQEKDVAIGRTASLLAHDVRKPLDQMKLVIEKLANGEVDKQFLEIAKKDLDISIATVDQQVSDIMNYSKKAEIHLTEISLYRILGHAIKQVMAIHQEMDITLEYDFKSHAKVLGDQARLSSALVNLIANAVEAIRDIGGRYKGLIRLSTEQVDGNFIFRIFNDGPAIPKEIVGQIFKPLFTNGKANGTGLGLASVLKSINEHSGSIEVKNIENKGVEFTLVLKKGFESDDWNAYSFKNSSKFYSYNIDPNASSRSEDSFKIFVLENDPKLIELINTTLSKLPYKMNIKIVSDSNDAQELFKKHRFDFYILNRQLGGDDIKTTSLSFLNSEVIVYSNNIPGDLEITFKNSLSRRERVLFVDDTKLFRLAWLMFHGEHNITCLSSPEEAIAYLEKSPSSIDIAVVDYHFSNSSMNGEALANKIKEINPKIKIMISSSIDQQIPMYKTISKKDYDVRRFLNRVTKFSY